MNYPVPSRSYIGDSDAFVGDYIDRFTRFWNNHNQGKLVWDNVYATNASITTLLKSVAFSPTTAGIVGTTTNDNAAAGNVGEIISSSVSFASRINMPTSTQYGDLTSIGPTAGDWDISLIVGFEWNSGIAVQLSAGIGTATGNSSTGLVAGDNWAGQGWAASTNGGGAGISVSGTTFISIPSYRVSISSTTTYYAKLNMTSTTVPTAYGRISARRMR